MNLLRQLIPVVFMPAIASPGAFALAPGVSDGLPARVFSERLDQRDLGLAGLGLSGPVIFDSDTRALVTGALAFYGTAPSGRTPTTEPWRLELIDGQVLIGRPRESVPAESLTWELPGGTALRVPLDLIRRMAEASSPALPFTHSAESRDLVHTTTGDRLLGFVSGLGSGVLIETDAGIIAIELSQVREVLLATEPEPSASPLIWLDDGTVLGARLTGSGEGVRVEFEPVLEVVSRSRLGLTRMLGEVRGVNFVPGRVRPLSVLGPPRVSPAEGRRWTPGPVFSPPGDLGLTTITLPGPMTLTWALPEGASAFSLRVELAPEARRWGDCLLRIETDLASSAPRAELRLSADNPAGLLRVSLDGAEELRLVVLPGERGPIQDRVILTEGLLLFNREGT